MNEDRTVKLSMLAGVGAVIGASLCCVAPLVLLALGIGGTWISALASLEPYRPCFVTLTLGALGFSAWRLYRPADDCAPGEVCAVPAVRRRQRLIFWIVAIPLLGLLAFPWYAPLFLH